MFPRSEIFLPPGLETLVSVFASSFVLGEGLIFSKHSPTRAHSTLLRPPRTPSPCAYVHVLCRCFPHRLSPACAISRIFLIFVLISGILRPPPTFAFPHPLWRRSDRYFPVRIGDSEITRTGSLFRSRFASRIPAPVADRGLLSLARTLPCRLYALGPVVLLVLLSRYSCCCDLR